MTKSFPMKVTAVLLTAAVIFSLFALALHINVRAEGEDEYYKEISTSVTETTSFPETESSTSPTEEETSSTTTIPTTEPYTEEAPPTTTTVPEMTERTVVKEEIYTIKQTSDKKWRLFDGNKRVYDTGIFHNEHGWYYVKDGTVDFNYTGITNNSYGWYRVEKGKVNFKANGVYKNEYGWWKVTNGKVNFRENGIYKNEYGWWKTTGSKVTFKENGVFGNEYGWWKVVDSKVDFKFHGLASNENGTWYLRQGKVQFDYDGIATDADGSYIIKGGRFDESAFRTLTVNGVTYPFVNGKSRLIGMNYIQMDSPWSNYTYNGMTLAESGCGILAMTNAIYNLNGTFLDPLEVANWAYKNKYFNADSFGGIKNRECFQKLAAQYGNSGGFKYAGKGTDISTAAFKKHLQNGGTAIVHVTNHFMAVIGYDAATGKYLVMDSYPGMGTSLLSKYRITTRYGDWLSYEDLSTNYKVQNVTDYWLYANA